MATAAFVLSFFSWIWFLGILCGILSLTFGGIAYRRAVTEGRQGKGLAIAAIIITALCWTISLIFWIVIIGAFTTGETST